MGADGETHFTGRAPPANYTLNPDPVCTPTSCSQSLVASKVGPSLPLPALLAHVPKQSSACSCPLLSLSPTLLRTTICRRKVHYHNFLFLLRLPVRIHGIVLDPDVVEHILTS